MPDPPASATKSWPPGRMPSLDGVAATRLLHADRPSTPVLALTTFDDDEAPAGMLRAGAAGFVLKGIPAEQLHRAVRVVAAGCAPPPLRRRAVKGNPERVDTSFGRPSKEDLMSDIGSQAEKDVEKDPQVKQEQKRMPSRKVSRSKGSEERPSARCRGSDRKRRSFGHERRQTRPRRQLWEDASPRGGVAIRRWPFAGADRFLEPFPGFGGARRSGSSVPPEKASARSPAVAGSPRSSAVIPIGVSRDRQVSDRHGCHCGRGSPKPVAASPGVA